uniref:NB-ARC domain-containing protein n=1 Tax=Kalanchoe fedtschenkoi TaxID=63787 RepID=A0A7N0U630_KALFE
LIGENGSNPPSSRYKYHEDALFLEEADVVGIEEPKQKLIGLLFVGMGGLGKTTLVKKVYDDNKVKMHFESHAWITVSQTFEIEELLGDLIQQLSGENRSLVPPETDNMDIAELKEQIHSLLNRNRYLIILDDVWKQRVMLTTRSADVAFSAGESIKYIYNLQPLSEEESWKLFCNKIYNGPCPENLIQSSQAILKKCGGLPLAIVTISGVLISKNQAEPHNWNQVNGSLGAELEDNRRLRSTYKILSLSYNVLPYHLIACFLYMSIFPEDHLIERLKLIRLWMAEGFLIEIKDMALEDVGESYLTDLVNRNLVQVAETSSDGRMKTCYVHDLLREIIKVKSRDQNFNSLSHFQQDQNLSQLRSLLMFEVEEQLTNSSIPSLFSGGLKLLTVLDLQGASLKKFPSAIVNLFNLRYLSLKNTQFKTMPNSIGMLQKLQTLDLKNTLISKIPNEILKLQQLRNLLIYRYKFETYTDFPSRYGFKAPSGIQSLTFLRKLCSVEGGQGSNIIIRELEILTQLRRLSLPAWISSLNKLTKIFLKSSRLQVDEDPLKTLEDLPNLVHVEFLQVCTGTTHNFKANTFKKLRILGLHEFESLETVKIEHTALPNLERFVINSCALLKTLPEGINKLSKLRVLDFITMPAELISAVQLFPIKGTDYDKLCHIPEVNHIEKNGSIWETKRLKVINMDDPNTTRSPHEDPMKDFNKK